MDKLIRDFERYLKEILGISIAAKKWEGVGRLPFFLRDLYLFYQVSLLDTLCLLMIARSEEEQTPATLRKQMLLVEEKWDGKVIYVHRIASAYNRKRLIEHKVPFVVPGNQMYLPPLGIDMREHFKKIRSTPPRFSPSTQAVILYAFFHGTEQAYTPSGLASQLGYAPMTLTRALDELAGAGLGEVAMEGRERVLRFREDKRALWEKARGYLRSPVKNRLWIRRPFTDRTGVQAGLTALSHYTMLAAPSRTVYALSAEDWKAIKQRGGAEERVVPEPEPESCELEVWSYSPQLFAENDVVDRFSLYLSLVDNTDERVQFALEDMMERISW